MVGLGNPGPEYAATRHNVGAMVADELVRRAQTSYSKAKRAQADVAEVRFGPLPGVPVTIARTREYMNTSGGPVSALVKYYSVAPEQLVVVHDELDIDFATLRLKLGGGDNGHNGLKSLRSSLGTGDFHRVRFGIGRPPGRQPAADFVLKPFSTAERKDLDWAVDRAADAVESLVLTDLAATQNAFNQ